MITNFNIFEKIDYYDNNGNLIYSNNNGDVIRSNKPNVNNYSDEFWKFITVANWNKIIKTKDEFQSERVNGHVVDIHPLNN